MKPSRASPSDNQSSKLFRFRSDVVLIGRRNNFDSLPISVATLRRCGLGCGCSCAGDGDGRRWGRRVSHGRGASLWKIQDTIFAYAPREIDTTPGAAGRGGARRITLPLSAVMHRAGREGRGGESRGQVVQAAPLPAPTGISRTAESATVQYIPHHIGQSAAKRSKASQSTI